MKIFDPFNQKVYFEDVKLFKNVITDKLIIAPTFFDFHTHVRLTKDQEDYKSLKKACIAGGFSEVLIQPNTTPKLETEEIHKEHKKLSENPYIKFYRTTSFFGQVEPNQKDILCYSTDGIEYNYTDLVENFSKKKPYLLLDHSQLFEHKGIFYTKEVKNIPKRPVTNEAIAVSRTVLTGIEFGFKDFHIQHVSTIYTLKMIEFLRKFANVTCEITPHHLLISGNEIKNSNYKINPPLPDKKTQMQLIEAVKKGKIDILATDHAPHPEKSSDLLKAPYGTSNIEIAFSAFYTAIDDLFIVIDKLSRTPRKRLNIKPIFNRDNFVVIDPFQEFTVDSKKFFSKGKNCVFDGMKLKGKILGVKINGKWGFWDGEYLLD